MGKKNYDSLLSNILGGAEIHPHDKQETPMIEQTKGVSVEVPSKDDDTSEEPWRHFTFICSVELIDKVQAIAHREGFTIRAFMEYMIRQGISQYESKHGKVRKIKVKAVKDVM
jgi:hypothetical protein